MFALIICVASIMHLAAVTGKPTAAPPITEPTPIQKEYFLYHYVQANWHNAYLFCRENGMQLATIKSQEEQNSLSQLIADKGLLTNWWISGSDQAIEGRFSWLAIGALFKFNNFDENQPDNSGGNEDCVYVRPNNRWNDAICELELPFVCERGINV